MKSRLLLLVLLTCAFLVAPAAAQYPAPPPPNGDYNNRLDTDASRNSANSAPRSEARVLTKGVLTPIETNSTYLLRSINYGTSDVLVAFRVVRQDPTTA